MAEPLFRAGLDPFYDINYDMYKNGMQQPTIGVDPRAIKSPEHAAKIINDLEFKLLRAQDELSIERSRKSCLVSAGVAKAPSTNPAVPIGNTKKLLLCK